MIRGSAPDDLVFEFYRAGEDEPHRVLTTSPQRFEMPDEHADAEEHVPRGTSDDGRDQDDRSGASN